MPSHLPIDPVPKPAPSLHRYFEPVVLVFVAMSAIVLALDQPGYHYCGSGTPEGMLIDSPVVLVGYHYCGSGAPEGMCSYVNVNELRLGFSNTTRNPEGILSHNNRKS